MSTENAAYRKPSGYGAEPRRREKRCPPHGPFLVRGVDEGPYALSGTYRASCLACGLEGPERTEGWEARLAFDEAFGALPEESRT